MSDDLLKFYRHQGDFYVLIRSVGTVVVESPADGDGKESVLRLFINLPDAIRYKDLDGHGGDTRVTKTTLVGLWGILDRINSLSLKQFHAPVRVDASAFNQHGQVVSVDILRSAYALLS